MADEEPWFLTFSHEAYTPEMRDQLVSDVQRAIDEQQSSPRDGESQWAVLQALRMFICEPYCVPTSLNKGMASLLTLVAGDLVCATPIAKKPAGFSYVRVFVNRRAQALGDGTNHSDVYFSEDGTTPRAHKDIAEGDKLYRGTWAGLTGVLAGALVEFDSMSGNVIPALRV